MEKILERILSIEAEAKATVSEAQEIATMLKGQSRTEVDEILAQALQKAAKEAGALQEKVRQETEEEKACILSQTTQGVRDLQVQGNFEKAVRRVVGLICGQEEG